MALTLRKARKIAGLTQVQLSLKAGCSQQFISELEKGRIHWANVQHQYIVCIARALNIEPEEIFPIECVNAGSSGK